MPRTSHVRVKLSKRADVYGRIRWKEKSHGLMFAIKINFPSMSYVCFYLETDVAIGNIKIEYISAQFHNNIEKGFRI